MLFYILKSYMIQVYPILIFINIMVIKIQKQNTANWELGGA